MKVLKAFGLAAGGALAAAAAVKIFRNPKCKQALLDAFNRVAIRVDQKIGCPGLPVPLALAVLAGDRNTLREKNLIDTNTPGVVPGALPAYPNVVTARTP